MNKVNTKVELRLQLADLDGITPAERERIRLVLSNRLLVNDDLLIVASEGRSQTFNRERAFSRAEALIVSAARIPKRRIATKPSKKAIENRLTSKKAHGVRKRDRSTKFMDD